MGGANEVEQERLCAGGGELVEERADVRWLGGPRTFASGARAKTMWFGTTPPLTDLTAARSASLPGCGRDRAREPGRVRARSGRSSIEPGSSPAMASFRAEAGTT
ncbi:hypothetical protein BRD12_08615 [Halobacteriales archaeon SW_12_67_38]|nr:MAG: hypothetical protein BRD12_08615 [Halobacteriales archaeon SW_12_67_38]